MSTRIGSLSNTVPRLEPSTTPVDGSLPPSSVPILESSFDSTSVPSSIPSSISCMEPSLEPSTASVDATYNDDGPTKSYHIFFLLQFVIAGGY
jgi:hypothetical protein